MSMQWKTLAMLFMNNNQAIKHLVCVELARIRTFVQRKAT